MSTALICLSAVAFLISIFPVHIIAYAYVSTGQKYASINITLYRLFTILNANTQKPPKTENDEGKEDGNDKKIMTPPNLLQMFNKLCITKIVQLGDYGLQNADNAYSALANAALTNAAYTFVRANGGKTKLKNYTVFNYEHAEINYYLKLTGVINLLTLSKLIFMFYWGKINEE